MSWTNDSAFRAAEDAGQTHWIEDAFRRSATIGRWALPDVFEDYLTVLASEPNKHSGPGTTAQSVSAALVRALRPFTSTPLTCFFGVWVGYAGLPEWPGAIRFEIPPQREMILLEGSIGSANESIESPDSDRRPLRWWPEDRAWMVGADIYSPTLSVGGSAECITAVRDLGGLMSVDADWESA